jgi:hypothetical protein
VSETFACPSHWGGSRGHSSSGVITYSSTT